jgi:hypothetical protein
MFVVVAGITDHSVRSWFYIELDSKDVVVAGVVRYYAESLVRDNDANGIVVTSVVRYGTVFRTANPNAFKGVVGAGVVDHCAGI